MAHGLCCHLGVRIRPVASCKQAFLTEPAIAAADREGYDDTIADLQVRHFGTERHDLPHILVAEDITCLHRRLVTIEQVKVGPANGACRDLDDGITGVLDLGIRDGVDANVTLTVPTQCAHNSLHSENRSNRRTIPKTLTRLRVIGSPLFAPPEHRCAFT